MSTSNPAKFDNLSDPHWFRSHREELTNLPDPECRWRWSETDLSKSLLQQASLRDVIVRVDGHDRMWRTRPEAWEMIRQLTNDDADPSPAGQMELSYQFD